MKKLLLALYIPAVFTNGCSSGLRHYKIETKQADVGLDGRFDVTYKTDTITADNDSEAYAEAYAHFEIEVRSREKIIKETGHSTLPASTDFTITDQNGKVVLSVLTDEARRQIDENVDKATQ